MHFWFYERANVIYLHVKCSSLSFQYFLQNVFMVSQTWDTEL